MAWSTATKKPLTGLMKVDGSPTVGAIAVHPDDRTIVAGTSDARKDKGQLIFWDLQKQLVAGSSKLPGSVASLEFSSDGRRLGVQFKNGQLDNAVCVWLALSASQDAEPGLVDKATTIVVNGGKFAFLPDEHRMVTAGSGAVQWWNLERLDRQAVYLGTKATQEAFSPDGRVLAVETDDLHLIPLDTQTPAAVGPAGQIPRDTDPVNPDLKATNPLVFSPDGNRVALASGQRTWIVDWRTGQSWKVPAERGQVPALAFSGDGKLLAVDDVKTVRSGTSWEDMEQMSKKHVDPWDKFVAPIFDSGLQLWDVVSHQPAGGRIDIKTSVSSFAISPDRSRVALAPSDGPVQVWDLNRRELITSAIRQSRWVAFFPDSRRLLAWIASDDSAASAQAGKPKYQVQVWDATSGVYIGPELKPDTGPVPQGLNQVFFFDNGAGLSWWVLTAWSSGTSRRTFRLERRSSSAVLAEPISLSTGSD